MNYNVFLFSENTWMGLLDFFYEKAWNLRRLIGHIIEMEVWPRSFESLVHKGTAWLVFGGRTKSFVILLGSGEAPLLDIAYGGYAFTGLSLAVLAGIFSKYAYYIVLPWMSFCMGVFLVKTLKRVLFAER